MYKLLKKSENGFSLLELVVAVAVAGIIAAVAVPTFIGLQGDATTEAASYETSISGNHSDVTNEAGYWNGNEETVNGITLNAAHFGSGSSHYLSSGTLYMEADASNTTEPSTAWYGTAAGAAALSNLNVGDQIVYSGDFTGTFTVLAISGTTRYTITVDDTSTSWWGIPISTSTEDSSVTVTFIYN